MTAAPGIMTATEAEQPGQPGTQPGGQPASQAPSQAASRPARQAARQPGSQASQTPSQPASPPGSQASQAARPPRQPGQPGSQPSQASQPARHAARPAGHTAPGGPKNVANNQPLTGLGALQVVTSYAFSTVEPHEHRRGVDDSKYKLGNWQSNGSRIFVHLFWGPGGRPKRSGSRGSPKVQSVYRELIRNCMSSGQPPRFSSGALGPTTGPGEALR